MESGKGNARDLHETYTKSFKTMCFIVFPSFLACRKGKINVFFRVFIIKKMEIDQKPCVFSAKVVREPSKFRLYLVFYEPIKAALAFTQRMAFYEPIKAALAFTQRMAFYFSALY